MTKKYPYAKCLLFLAVFLFLGKSIFAQANTPIDEIKKQLKAASVDSERVRYLYRLGDAYLDVDLAKAMWYADTAMRKAEQINWLKGIGNLHLLKGNILSAKGQHSVANVQYVQAYRMAKKISDKRMMAAALNDLATGYSNKGDYVTAYKFLSFCLKLAEQIKDDMLIARSYQNIGTLFSLQEDHNKALLFRLQALKFFTKAGNNAAIAGTNIALGENYFLTKNYKTALRYSLEALKLYEAGGNLDGIAQSYSLLGANYAEYGDLPKALTYELKAQQIWDSINPHASGAVFNLGNIGQSYIWLIKKDSANRLLPLQKQDYLQKAAAYTEKSVRLSEKNNDKHGEYHYLSNLAEIKQWQGDYKSAYIYSTRSFNLRDSIFSQENKNKIAAIENQKALDVRDQQLRINALALKNERRTKVALVAGAVLLLIIGGLLFYQNQARSKTNTTLLKLNTALTEANTVKTRFFGILSHDLRSPVARLIHFLHLQKEAPGLLDATGMEVHQQKLTASAENLLDTMEAILLWSKSQMERFAPHEAVISVESFFSYIQNQIPEAIGLKISFLNPDNLLVYTDEDFLKTIMYNLSTNAVKAVSEVADAHIEWTAKRQGHEIELTITDNGPGFRKEQLEALYDDNAVVGTKHGLGLHLIRDLAKAIHCRVRLNEQAKGASFSLFVPNGDL